MLHLRLFDSSLYYTLASVSSGMLPPPQASNGSQLTLTGAAAGIAPAEAAVNLTYFTPAISHVMLAPTPTTASAAQTTAAATTVTPTTASTTTPGSDFQASATTAASGDNLTLSYAGELDNLNSFYFYEVGTQSIKKTPDCHCLLRQHICAERIQLIYALKLIQLPQFILYKLLSLSSIDFIK